MFDITFNFGDMVLNVFRLGDEGGDNFHDGIDGKKDESHKDGQNCPDLAQSQIFQRRNRRSDHQVDEVADDQRSRNPGH